MFFKVDSEMNDCIELVTVSFRDEDELERNDGVLIDIDDPRLNEEVIHDDPGFDAYVGTFRVRMDTDGRITIGIQ
jgi:hypothetical protein